MSEWDTIIHAEEWKEFARCFAAKRWCVATAGERGRFRALLSGWEIDAICRFVSLPITGAIRMHFHGMRVSDPAYRDSTGRVVHSAVRALLDTGASLNFGRMEHYSNTVLRLSRVLEAELRCRVQVNLYQTPAGGQGLGSHVDEHDVWVLQLEGEKQWQVCAAENGLATPAGSAGETTVRLRAGDWLYLPRGIRHEVRNSGRDPSVHLTIGFHPSLTEGALGETIPDTEVPDRGALDAANADTCFAWRTGVVSLTRAANGLELDLSYRRAPLVLYRDVEPWLERMSQVPDFCPRDLGSEDLEAATLLARFLAGAGVLVLRQRRAPLASERAHSRSPMGVNRPT